MALYEEKKDKKKFLDKINQNNTIMPGGRELFDTAKQVKEAYQKGGFSSAAGIGLRNIPRVFAATTRDIIAPEPLRRGLRKLAGETAEFGKAAILGEVTPTSNGDQILEDDTKTLPQQSLSQLPDPLINEIPNIRRDTELGKMTSSAEALDDGGQKNTFSIGGNTLSYNLSPHDLAVKKSIEDIDARIAQGFEPTPEQAQKIAALKKRAGFTRGGTDRDLSSDSIQGLQQLGNGLDVTFDESVPQDRRLAFMRASSGEMSERETNARNLQHQQWLGRQGYREPDPYAGLGNRAKRELMVQEAKNKQSGIESTAADVTATERNRILEEQNIRENKRLLRPTQTKSGTKVIKVPDGFGGFKEEIWTDRSDVKYTRAMQNQQKPKPMPRNKNELISGESYLLPDGRMGIWDGENFSL